jgi:peptidoglycan/LPS O-acetylase OafA/YrhL
MMLVPFSQLFIVGATVFLILRDGPTLGRYLALGACLVMAIANAIDQESGFAENPTTATGLIITLVTIAFFAFFLVVALKAWRPPTSRIWLQLGALTYPLYLLHNQIGKTIWWAIPEDVGPWLRLLTVVVGVGLLTWAVTTLVEKRWPSKTNSLLQGIIMRVGRCWATTVEGECPMC